MARSAVTEGVRSERGTARSSDRRGGPPQSAFADSSPDGEQLVGHAQTHSGSVKLLIYALFR